ncbi:hypothetical protein J2X38_000325 [Sphingopyxis sp. BE235]|nr:hypothetical protein [Sphingopyxis sp. BE235]MDR7179525.1 hypothetical protein [Sphingopyxis sp. BE249]
MPISSPANDAILTMFMINSLEWRARQTGELPAYSVRAKNDDSLPIAASTYSGTQ